LGLVWAFINVRAVLSVNLEEYSDFGEEDKGASASDKALMLYIGDKIEKGADAFLRSEYLVLAIFVFLFSGVVFLMVDTFGNNIPGVTFYATISFIIGSLTSMFCGYLGMKIAVKSNFRTAYQAITSLSEAFNTAFRAGCVMGFTMISLSLLTLISTFLIFEALFEPSASITNERSWAVLMEFMSAYGLGGSAVALFGRVGGGIYTKAADVGADLVGKLEEGLDEDSPKNPATIADNVGDNVGDIAGMGADLFGSFAEATCAALVFIANSPNLISVDNGKALYFPMLISAFGIVACIISSAFGIYFYEVDSFELIERALKYQLVISTVLILLTIPVAALLSLPSSWKEPGRESESTLIYAVIATGLGLVSGLIIGFSTDYYTSNAHHPVQEMSAACQSGPAINIIYGLALGYNSTIVPVILLAATVITSILLLGLFGVALAAIGMLSNLCVGLAIDAYGPISDNAGGTLLLIKALLKCPTWARKCAARLTPWTRRATPRRRSARDSPSALQRWSASRSSEPSLCGAGPRGRTG
jgi:H(+)-translocating pyrophosphatase